MKRDSCLRILVLMMLLMNVGRSAPAEGTSVKAQDIVKRMAKKYAKCSTYQDHGVVEITFLEKAGKRVDKRPFKTYFARPNMFRFEWTNRFPPGTPERKYIVWCDGTNTYASWGSDKYEKQKSLELGIAGATGVSARSAHTIPRLLMEQVRGFALTNLKNLSLVGEAVLDGKKCYYIKGEDPRGNISELWIGKEDHLLRKVRRKSEFENFSTVTEEIHRGMKVDDRIAKEIFNYRPPEGVKLKGHN